MNRIQAEEHLRVIRSLMEKATIYRAISAPTALVGGLLSMIVGLLLYFQWERIFGVDTNKSSVFIGSWLVVLGLTGAVNACIIHHEAKRRGEKFVSAGMKKALWALFPPLLCGAGFTVVLSHAYQVLPCVWMIFYGLALLATTHFSPRAIPRLGWGFVFAGLLAAWWLFYGRDQNTLRGFETPNLFMLITFGGFHLIYAVCTWRRSEESGV
jgi:hypothetical protein